MLLLTTNQPFALSMPTLSKPSESIDGAAFAATEDAAKAKPAHKDIERIKPSLAMPTVPDVPPMSNRDESQEKMPDDTGGVESLQGITATYVGGVLSRSRRSRLLVTGPGRLARVPGSGESP